MDDTMRGEAVRSTMAATGTMGDRGRGSGLSEAVTIECAEADLAGRGDGLGGRADSE